MTKNRIRVAAATAALAPIIALGSGFATAAPADSVVPVIAPVPVQVEPAVLLVPFTLGLSLLGLPLCFLPPILPLGTVPCIVAV
ncbi:hypothetical protein ACFVAV_07325 [Nocardia sp. NPDC057663]|uniref:hypothetical protein n=1 Tax=Nocardia sp. NPDC057663 TaxID=3346201 RepID=UPI00366B42DD